ncbi:MAG: sigma 54-interacting transcriptional regulator, partial [Oscillibacter sp.]
KEVRRVGGNRVIPVDVRILTATNKDLMQEVAEHRFREDLYYRLNVLDLEIPPLRERGRDVDILGLHYFNSLCGVPLPEVQKKYLELLAQMRDYAWHGNIRELQSFTERIHILLQNNTEAGGVMAEMMRRRGITGDPGKIPPVRENTRERDAILAALREYPESLEAAARHLGCSRQTLWRKMKKYEIQKGETFHKM